MYCGMKSCNYYLLNRNKMSELEQHHENALVLHAEFPKAVHIIAEESYINFFN